TPTKPPPGPTPPPPDTGRPPSPPPAASDKKAFNTPGAAALSPAPADPTKGIAFDGRLAEDFKLTTGTWVHVGGLRVGALAAASPALQDAIVAGENRAFIALLAWLHPPACPQLIRRGGPLVRLAPPQAAPPPPAAAASAWDPP